MGILTGFDVDDMLDDIMAQCGTPRSTPNDAIVVRYINRVQLWLYRTYDWPCLRVSDASLTLDGSTSYDLAGTALNGVGSEGEFGRMFGKTIRIGDNYVPLIGKNQWDEYDPDRSQGTTEPYLAAILNRNDFRVLPYGLTGMTCYFDYIKLPDAVTSATVAADISFDPELHELLIEGAMWMAQRKWTQQDWLATKRAFDYSAKHYYGHSKTFIKNVHHIVPRRF